ncbi:hypothetical protein [Rhizobium sp. SGZ-381]|uniref:hypothetical protein n=1 Tax=Rhizobium sp. SGZ-381 TaxID=3342800 RepID=UPI00367064DD
MTMILDHRIESGQRRWQLPSLPLLHKAFALAALWRAAYRRRQTERLLEALPFDARKDIGWPAGDAAETRRR